MNELVTVQIIRVVRPGMEAAFEAALHECAGARQFLRLAVIRAGAANKKAHNFISCGLFDDDSMEPEGFEPPTSCLQSRRSTN